MVGRLKIEHQGNTTRVTDLATGQEIDAVTSIEIIGMVPGKMFAVVKFVGRVEEFSGEMDGEVKVDTARLPWWERR